MKPKKNHIWLFFDSPELITIKPNYKEFAFKFTDSNEERQNATSWDYFEAIEQFNYTFYTDIFTI